MESEEYEDAFTTSQNIFTDQDALETGIQIEVTQ